jgi:hypothetical protein
MKRAGMGICRQQWTTKFNLGSSAFRLGYTSKNKSFYDLAVFLLQLSAANQAQSQAVKGCGDCFHVGKQVSNCLAVFDKSLQG